MAEKYRVALALASPALAPTRHQQFRDRRLCSKSRPQSSGLSGGLSSRRISHLADFVSHRLGRPRPHALGRKHSPRPTALRLHPHRFSRRGESPLLHPNALRLVLGQPPQPRDFTRSAPANPQSLRPSRIAPLLRPRPHRPPLSLRSRPRLRESPRPLATSPPCHHSTGSTNPPPFLPSRRGDSRQLVGPPRRLAKHPHFRGTQQ